MSHNCRLQCEGTHSPGIKVNLGGHFPVVCNHFLVVSVINGVIRDPKFGHLNFRVTQSSVGDSCITQSVAEIEMVCEHAISTQKFDETYSIIPSLLSQFPISHTTLCITSIILICYSKYLSTYYFYK